MRNRPHTKRFRAAGFAAGLLALLVIADAAGAADRKTGYVLPLQRDHLVMPDPAPENVRTFQCYCPHPSERNLLQLERQAPYAAGKRAAGAEVPITLKVVGVRVQFQYEETDDPLTTGRGNFDLRDTTTYFEENQHHFDSSPHNRRYFMTHLRALNLYWNVVSNGELSLNWTVFPEESDSAYQLPELMSYYGRDRGPDSGGVAAGLEQFINDAAAIASEDPALNFNDYDAVIFFHPGSDRQSDIFQDTPNDLFTAFLRTGKGVALAAGATDELTEAIIMPETMIQDNRITVLNSVMAHEFGHQLGLVDLYNTRSFLTQIGNFSLMDNNAADVGIDVEVAGRRRIMFGALPVFPDAWSRLYLGFVTPKEVVQQTRIEFPAAEEEERVPQFRNQVIKVPISETEYYLIENRRFDIDGLGDAGLRLDTVTNIVLEPVDTVFVTANREYDFLLPGVGALIWHIDEGVAAEDYVTSDDIPDNFLANTLQWDPNRRFVRLIEADGLVNFGGYFSAGTGTRFDYFYSPNNDSIGPKTNPPTISNTGGYTGIHIYDISQPLPEMTLSVLREGLMPGFPAYCGADTTSAGAPIVTDLTPNGNTWTLPGDGRPEIFAGYKHYILGWDWRGQPFPNTQPVIDTVLSFDTSVVTQTLYPIAVGNASDGGWVSPPLIADNLPGTTRLAAVARNGHVYGWTATDQDQDGLFDPLFDRNGRGVAAEPLIWADDDSTRMLVVPMEGESGYNLYDLSRGSVGIPSRDFPGTVKGIAGDYLSSSVAVFRSDEGESADRWWVGPLTPDGDYRFLTEDSLHAPALGDIDRDGSLDAVILSAAGELWVLDTGLAELDGFPVETGVTPTAAPVLADVDLDGYLDIIVVGDGQCAAYGRNGALLSDFPITLGRANAPDSGAAAPIAADLGTPDALHLMTAGQRRVVHGYDGHGRQTDNLPVPLGGESMAPSAWAVSDYYNEAAVFTRANDGFLYAYKVPFVGDPVPPTWPMASRNARLTRTVPRDDLAPVSVDDEFFVAERAFVYPNPASDHAIVRYWLGDDATVHIRIFDVAGNLVADEDGPGKGGLYNEWTWNCAQAASGVYFAHVEVVRLDTGKKETVLCKMAVVQ
jgi:M6 family metalloprotease-like protein